MPRVCRVQTSAALMIKARSSPCAPSVRWRWRTPFGFDRAAVDCCVQQRERERGVGGGGGTGGGWDGEQVDHRRGDDAHWHDSEHGVCG
jgi:hypothetical protein